MARDAVFEDEKKKAEAFRDGLLRFLSHDTSSAREELVRTLKERIKLIEVEIKADIFLDSEFSRIARSQRNG